VVEPPGGVTGPRRRSPRASPRRLLARRLAALAGIVFGVTALAWLGVTAVRALDDEREPAPPATTATRPRAAKTLRIIFPEGFTRRQMAARITAVNGIARRRRSVRPRLSARQYLAVTARSDFPRTYRGRRRSSLEGFLFPAVYEFTARTTTGELVRKQLDAFRRNWAKVDLRYARSKNLTPYDVLIIASMVEEEVAAARERPLVAAVIYNRLRAGMKLGIDATIRYALHVPPTQSLRLSQLHDPTPYNTRLHRGLPPTPITNPGLAAIKAAAHPARVDYLYFVRTADCRTHFFTASEREFLARLARTRC
jgi:UPF0755 protein